MKLLRTILLAMAMALATLTGIVTTSCEDYVELNSKWYDSGFELLLVDETGTNLLNPTVDGNYMDSDIVFTYNDVDFDVDWRCDYNPEEDLRRSSNSDETPIGCVKYTYYDKKDKQVYWYKNQYIIKFVRDEGPFPIEFDEKYQLKIPGIEKPYEIRLQYKYKVDEEDEYYVRRIWVDGVVVDHINPITILVPRLPNVPAVQ